MMVDVDELERAARVGMQRAGGDRIVTMRADDAMDVAVELRAARQVVVKATAYRVAQGPFDRAHAQEQLDQALAAYDKVTGEATADA
jgi:hypothetical protein